MSRSGSLTFTWGDGEYRFRLAIGELEQLQEKMGCSPFTVLDRLRVAHPLVFDAREVLRLGLIGGGMSPPEALAKVRFYADARPLAESIPAAIAVLAASLYGIEDEAPGKSLGESETEAPLPEAG